MILTTLAACLAGCRPATEPPDAKRPPAGNPHERPTITVAMPETAEEKAALLAQLKSGFLEPGFREQLFDCKRSELPFTETIGQRGAIFTFASAFRGDHTQDLGLALDVKVLSHLEPADCFGGAGTFPVQPFLCELPTERWPLQGVDILAALKARHFHSAHLHHLEATHIPYPGYHPGGNDEIHNDFDNQYIFQHRDDRERLDKDAASRGNHGLLQRHVKEGRLWYVLLHPKTRGAYVILFAVGASRNGNRLLGVVTQQVCHNLCD